MKFVDYREKKKKSSNRFVEARWCSGYPIEFSIRLLGRSEGLWLEARCVCVLTEGLERLRKTFTANGKREITPSDHVYIILTACCFQFLCLIE